MRASLPSAPISHPSLPIPPLSLWILLLSLRIALPSPLIALPSPLIALPSLSAQERAQTSTASLGGRIVDARTGASVAGAIVRLDGSGERAESDQDGRFSLYGLAPGDRLLLIRYGGYEAEPQPVELMADRHVELRIAVSVPLSPDPGVPVVALPPLGVEIRRGSPRGKLRGFYVRMEREQGHFITREQILERSPFQTSDLLREVPGITVARADFGNAAVRVTRHRRCPIDMFLDGVHAPGFRIDDVPPMDIAGIEVYRGASEVPIAYRRHETCAAILIWTRDPALPDP